MAIYKTQTKLKACNMIKIRLNKKKIPIFLIILPPFVRCSAVYQLIDMPKIVWNRRALMNKSDKG